MKNSLNYLMLWYVAIITMVVLYNSFLSFYPFKTLVVNRAYVKTQTIKPGDVLTYFVDYCKYTDQPANVFRTFHSVDETRSVPFASITTITVPGCHVVEVPLQTFDTIEPGKYYLLVNVVFQINTQRIINVNFRTDDFEIK